MRRAPFWAVALILLGTCGCSVAAADAQWSLGTQQSRWREWSSDGTALLEERGTLMVLAWQGSLRHDSLDIGWRLQFSDGARDYTGRNSLGTPITTTVSLRDGSAALNLGWPAGAVWQWRAALQPTWLQRELHGTANALGYTERWRWTQGATGVRWQRPMGSGTWRMEALALMALDSQLRVQLPGRDTATLHPKGGRGWQLSAAYAVPWVEDWQW